MLLGSFPAVAGAGGSASGSAVHTTSGTYARRQAHTGGGSARRAKGTRGKSRHATRSRRHTRLRGSKIALRAGSLVGVSLSKFSNRVPDDCTGLARLAYQRVGIDLLDRGSLPGENGVTAIHRRAALRKALHRHRPRPGDLVFFRDTWDRNGDGQWNDGLTHIGVVERVEHDGTVIFVHRAGGGVKRSRMNLRFPARRGSRAEGFLNDYLRRATDSDRAYLTGELFEDFAASSRL